MNELRIHTGRFVRLPEQERVCQLCIDEVEDERHFLLRCAFFSREREILWRRIDQLVNAGDGSDSDARQLDDAVPEKAADGWFHVADLPERDQLLLMMGGRIMGIPTKPLQRRVMSAILVALAGWTEKHAVWRKTCGPEAMVGE